MSSSRTYDVITLNFTPEQLFIKRLDTLKTNCAVLAKDTYFDGGDVLACQAGRFLFSFRGEQNPIELSPGEILVIYPGNIVTIEATARNSLLKYTIFGGIRVADFFDSFGFYDRLRFSGDTQEQIFDTAVKTSATDIGLSLAFLRDALTTFSRNLQVGERGRLHRSLSTIHRSVNAGTPRIKLICDELGITRSTLNRLFDEYDLGTPSDYVHGLQFRRALRLLQTTDLPIHEVAQQIGIPSPVYFTEFIRKYAGTTPSTLRTSRLGA